MQGDQNNPMSKMLNTAKNIAVHKLKKLALKGAKKVALILFKVLAPILGPLLLVLGIAIGAYMIIYAIPAAAIEENVSNNTLIAAFFGTTEDDELVEDNARLFDEYKEIADRWDEGLSDNQRGQVIVHKFPWSMLIATDRVINDASVWEGGENINLQPEKVFNELRPRFEWKDSTITTTTRTCTVDDKGKKSCSTDVDTEDVALIVKADTLEGEFVYEYEWQTERSEKSNGGYVEVKQEVLSNAITPTERFKPWEDYLEDEYDITDQDTKDLIVELALLYDEEYQLNYSLITGMDYSSYPVIEGSNGWLWPTPSTRITSPFGPRWGGFHHGTDIGATTAGVAGDPIWSMEDGRVITASWAGAYGNVVFVEHDNNVVSVYAHLHRIHVRQGDRVDKGDVLGIMGTTGRSTGVHLHFEIRKGGNRLDPMYFF